MGGGQCFAVALADLCPVLRSAVMKCLSDQGSNTQFLAQNAARLFQMLRDGGLDGGADIFLTLCGHLAGPVETPVRRSADVEELQVPRALGDVESFLVGTKRRRLHCHEPWTAVGTVLDHVSLDVHCPDERPHVPSTSMEQLASSWRSWAAEGAAVRLPAELLAEGHVPEKENIEVEQEEEESL